MKELFTTIRGWCVIFGTLVSLLFVNAAYRVYTPEWSRHSESIVENIVTPTHTDRCATCHQDAAEQHPNNLLSIHPAQRFGCTFCHNGFGRAVTSEDAHARSHPEKYLVTGTEAQSRCLACHESQFRLEHAPVLSDGKRLLYEKRCIRCHQISPFAVAYPGLERYYGAGNLGRIASGMTDEWMFRFVKRPQAVAPRTGMPFFDFSDDDAQAIVSYLASKRQPLPVSGFRMDRVRSASAARGETLASSLGCLGCHAVRGKGNPQAVEGSLDMTPLGSMFNEEFLFSWLYPVGRGHQPPIPLSEPEAYDLTAWLSSLKAAADRTLPARAADSGLVARGETLIRDFNCYGCHAIPGFENVPPSLPELSSVGDKPFGTPTGRRSYFLARIRNPKGVDLHARMPVIAMTDAEAESIATVLEGLRSNAVPEPFKTEISEREEIVQEADRMATHQFKCHLCHRLPWQRNPAAPQIAGPDLAITASKLSISAIAEKLSTPHRQIPNQTRMPMYQLSDEEVLTLIRALRLK